ncbi:MAG: short-chain-enoyl-CoA hydratase [Vicingaceae bacterium]
MYKNTMEKIQFEYTHNNTVANIILNDGKGNVLDNVMMLEIIDCLDDLKSKNDIKLIVFEGAGKHFSFGASVEEHTKEMAEAMLKTFHKMFFKLSELSIPTIAKVTGQCLGGGMELAIYCSLIFADESAKFGQPEIVLGVFPPPASVILPEKIGLARAEELLITGKVIDATEAKNIGLVNQVFSNKEDLNTGVNDWIEKYIVPKSASSLKFAQKASRIKFNHVFGNFIPQLEYMYLNKLMETADANEGINAFIEKRNPNWVNA